MSHEHAQYPGRGDGPRQCGGRHTIDRNLLIFPPRARVKPLAVVVRRQQCNRIRDPGCFLGSIKYLKNTISGYEGLYPAKNEEKRQTGPRYGHVNFITFNIFQERACAQIVSFTEAKRAFQP